MNPKVSTTPFYLTSSMLKPAVSSTMIINPVTTAPVSTTRKKMYSRKTPKFKSITRVDPKTETIIKTSPISKTSSIQRVSPILDLSPAQTTKISQTQKQKQQQRQKLTPITTTITTPTTPTILTPPTTNPPFTPPVAPPTFIPPPPTFEYFPKMSLGLGKSYSRKKVKQPKEYTPSAFAAGFKIKGKSTKLGIKSGLGLRPIKI